MNEKKNPGPPSLPDVIAFVTANGYAFDPERFFLHQTAKNWKGVPWHEAARLWQKTERAGPVSGGQRAATEGIDGDSPRWRRRVLENCAENLVQVFDGEERAELLVSFPPADLAVVRSYMDTLEAEDPS